jgi:hypothetical protein
MNAKQTFILAQFLRNTQQAFPNLAKAKYRELVRLEAKTINSPAISEKGLDAFFVDHGI